MSLESDYKIQVLPESVTYSRTRGLGTEYVRVFTLMSEARILMFCQTPDGDRVPISLFLTEIEEFVQDALARQSRRVGH